MSKHLPSTSSFGVWRRTTLAPLEVPLFRALWFGAMAANFASVAQVVAASWAMTTLSASASMVALVQTAAAAPYMLLALPAGAIADSFERRAVMLIAQCGAFVGSIALAAMALAGMTTPLMLLSFTALIAGALTFHQPAWQASFADVVPRELLPATVALSALTYNVARSVGPAVGGAITGLFGPGATFALTALASVGLITVLATSKFEKVEVKVPREAIGAAILTGLRFAAKSQPIKAVLARTFAYTFSACSIAALAPLIAQQRLGGGPVIYGMLLSAFGVGALVAALGSAHFRSLLGGERMTSLALATYAVATLCVGLSSVLAITLVCMTAAGAAWTFTMTTATTCMQLSSPRWIMGRSFALYQVATLGGMALGSALWGEVAHRAGLVTCFIVSALCVASNLLAAKLLPLPNSDGLSPSAAVLTE